MRSVLIIFVGFLSAGSILFMSGCIDRPELSPRTYGTILQELPTLEEAEAPFPFPRGEDGNDHQTCTFDEFDF